MLSLMLFSFLPVTATATKVFQFMLTGAQTWVTCHSCSATAVKSMSRPTCGERRRMGMMCCCRRRCCGGCAGAGASSGCRWCILPAEPTGPTSDAVSSCVLVVFAGHGGCRGVFCGSHHHQPPPPPLLPGSPPIRWVVVVVEVNVLALLVLMFRVKTADVFITKN